ncbi:MAG TPA: BamA/TamA family outer membrane protein [Mucilaginibacter sp.]|jgi:outer membrane protein assembly factor BamA|nr:BamA/TamA family outer membrane protein [Mucilaginibacter sp.]
MVRGGKLVTIITILLLASVAFTSGRADAASYSSKVIGNDTVRQKDLMDLVRSMLRSGSSQKSDSVGSKPVVSMVPAVGYALQSRMAVLLSGNMAFRTGPQARISVVNFGTSYTQNAQFTLPLLWNIWSRSNDYNFVGDMRFYAYPQNTYGLGSNSDNWQQDPMDYNYFRFSETVLRHVTGNLYVGAGYVMDNHWGISHQTPIATGIPGFSNYNTATHTVSSGFTLNGVYDSRDNSINPSRGFYAMYQFRENLPQLGSTSAWNSLVLDVRKYVRFPANSNNTLAFWSYDWLTLSGAPPYLDLPSTLWDANTNAGRGYIQGRFRGAQMLYAETEYRYRITRDGLIGGVFFVNAQSFSAAPGTRLQTIQPGYGPGLRIKLNKVSKTNISMDYGFGAQGSHGLFVNVGELF